MSRDYSTYESPFCTRYASKEMQYIFSADKKFSTWRRLWVALARGEMKLGLPVTQEQVDELESHINDINYDVAEEREKLVSALKALPIPLKKLAPIEEAIVTRGGVNVREIDPATMESRKVSGLYFAGEVIDVDAHTGGYNLQIAWATGALAGQSAGEEEIEAI